MTRSITSPAFSGSTQEREHGSLSPTRCHAGSVLRDECLAW